MRRNDLITFGAYNWRVLEGKAGKLLIITEEIVELRWYHSKFVEITWADCALRSYLNSEFYNTFKEEERRGIMTVVNKNPDSPWFPAKGGKETLDKIFLLSLEEVCTYFGNSWKSLQNKGAQRWQIDDENNHSRQAKYNNEFHWWRLRSPGYYGRTAASVNKNGCVYVRGNGVHGKPKDGGGLRPALWLKVADRDFEL